MDRTVITVGVIGALLVQRRTGASRLEDAQQSSWQAAKAVRPIPRELASLLEVRRAVVGLKVVLCAALLAVPLVVSESRVNLAGVIVICGLITTALLLGTGPGHVP